MVLCRFLCGNPHVSRSVIFRVKVNVDGAWPKSLPTAIFRIMPKYQARTQ
jgi:hypothetical protein